jgi:hypothetical protein
MFKMRDVRFDFAEPRGNFIVHASTAFTQI